MGLKLTKLLIEVFVLHLGRVLSDVIHNSGTQAIKLIDQFLSPSIHWPYLDIQYIAVGEKKSFDFGLTLMLKLHIVMVEPEAL